MFRGLDSGGPCTAGIEFVVLSLSFMKPYELSSQSLGYFYDNFVLFLWAIPRGTQNTILAGSGTIWEPGDWTPVSHVQSKCSAHCATAPAPDKFYISAFHGDYVNLYSIVIFFPGLVILILELKIFFPHSEISTFKLSKSILWKKYRESDKVYRRQMSDENLYCARCCFINLCPLLKLQ